MKHEALGKEGFMVAEQSNFPGSELIKTYYWKNSENIGGDCTTAIFRLYPGRTNPRRWMRDNLKTTDNE